MPTTSSGTYWSSAYLADSYFDSGYWGLAPRLATGIFWNSDYDSAAYFGPNYWTLSVVITSQLNFIDPDEVTLIDI